MNTDEMLSIARQHCFFIGINDSGAELCRANAVYGMAGIHWIQKKLGMRPDATFISTPDMTITRNTDRWESGFGYGGKISWGSGEDELVILNTKPNACGMLVGSLGELPDAERLIEGLHALETTPREMDGVELSWDFYKSNHFIDLFRVKPVPGVDGELPPFAFIIHGSTPEFREDNALGFGLYHDKSRTLREMAEEIATPFGTFRVLTGTSASEYYEKYRFVDEFGKRKRRLAAEILFGDYGTVANVTHQGLINVNEINLGCHHVQDGEELFPLTLRGDLPGYLVRGNPSLSEESIDMLGFEKRARKHGVLERLLHADIIPHGGGYVLPDILTVNRVREIGGKRYFEVEMANDRGKQYISGVRDLPYEYRGRNVVLRSLEVGLIEIAAKLIPQYVLKI
jgi:hypothetical protein